MIRVWATVMLWDRIRVTVRVIVVVRVRVSKIVRVRESAMFDLGFRVR